MKLPFIHALLAVPVAAAILVAGAGPSIADGGGGPGDIPKETFDRCYAVIASTPDPEDPEVEVCWPTR